MSDHEFENYLTLIGRLLRLSAPQREAIGAELRDHFESRLAELIGQGRSHEDAARLALEEFGDAAGLAAQFSYITQSRRRRLIMRCTVASVAALAAAVLVAMAMWPDNRATPVLNQAIAQAAATNRPEIGSRAIVRDLSESDRDQQVENRLKRVVEKVDFVETPLSDVLSYLSDKYGLQIYVKKRHLQEEGLDPTTTPVTLSLSNVQLRTVLDLMFDEIANGQLGYMARDGILIVSTKSDVIASTGARVFNCRKMMSGIAEGKPAYGGGVPPESPAMHLINVIKSTVAKTSWEGNGGEGTIADYDGMLVVSNAPDVLDQVASLLETLSRELETKALK